MTESRPFWMVWNPDSRPPCHKHPTQDAAQREAERLARIAPGSAFYVLKAISIAQRIDVKTTALCAEGVRDGEFDDVGKEIPF